MYLSLVGMVITQNMTIEGSLMWGNRLNGDLFATQPDG
jgi:hypothetical protein